ncbi:RNA-directed DNA polymerase [Vibrio crassostreae]|nr:RNA-directed DNA polymerase [Vibrio crassostreae]CAK1783826.1 RNA-directed DNA polymerase [Vibrio crassostreae]CAK2243558.1 RNA-directed DNA polymerase [Vibrio crassostreae]CAK2374637.1 RNA-directed DNA polymerase [Vibrio crassostreae]CAK2589795.1 RNA-directed DNA polymerase [Vibrio crassostreae]
MVYLTDDSLEFARQHILSFYDSDFFPKSDEFIAIWHSWESIKASLLDSPLGEYKSTTPRTAVSYKPKGGFRVVQQLDPLDTLVYVALTYLIAEKIETVRIPIEENVDCAYRISLHEGSFFSKGGGYKTFIEQTEKLAKEHDYLLSTDITDCYSQLYLKKLINTITSADSNLESMASYLHDFLSDMNNNTSQGVPVGPAPSIIMAEAILSDIDLFLKNKGVEHTRYVDDFRIFSDSKKELLNTLESLTIYLFDNHKLTLSSEKTTIGKSSDFVVDTLNSYYELQRNQVLDSLDELEPYAIQAGEIAIHVEDQNEVAADNEDQLLSLAKKITERNILDLGMARALLRKARMFKTKILVPVILEKFDFFAPAINDVCLYLDTVTDADLIAESEGLLIGLLKEECINRGVVKYWFEWYIANNIETLKVKELKRYLIEKGSITSQSLAAITCQNIAWVREMKTKYNTMGEWDKRAILRAVDILPTSEAELWESLINKNGSVLERITLDYVLADDLY